MSRKTIIYITHFRPPDALHKTWESNAKQVTEGATVVKRGFLPDSQNTPMEAVYYSNNVITAEYRREIPRYEYDCICALFLAVGKWTEAEDGVMTVEADVLECLDYGKTSQLEKYHVVREFK
jgi:hypothetical protein